MEIDRKSWTLVCFQPQLSSSHQPKRNARNVVRHHSTTHSTFLQHNKGAWQNKCAPLVCTGSDISTWWNRSLLLNGTRLEHSEQFIFATTKKNFVKCTISVPNGFSVLLATRRRRRHVLTTSTWQPETTSAVKWLTNRLRPVHCRVL